MTDFEVVIGLETHIQLNTESKIFCRCRADSWGEAPNSNICPVCCGLPGVLPVLNRSVAEKAVRLAYAMGADVSRRSFFARKNYFYPDLPKGYQISQFDEPVARGGAFELRLPDGSVRRVRIHKLHVEEDAGKTKRIGNKRYIDMNRCGVPLIEMVTEPDLRSADEAVEYLVRLRHLLRWLEISEANMERAQLRCDANVSIRPRGAGHLNPKTEIKNVNSIEAVRAAIRKETARQQEEVSAGRPVLPWTLEWDEDAGMLRKMRSKETEAEYRYFREPDLLPLDLALADCERIRSSLPEMPLERRNRFARQYALPAYDAQILTEDRASADFFEDTAKVYGGDAKKVSNWMMNEVSRMMRDRGVSVSALGLRAGQLAEILQMLDDGEISPPTAKSLLDKVAGSGNSPREMAVAEGLTQIGGGKELEAICAEAIADHPEQVVQYAAGKKSLLQFFVGQVMKKSRGQASPQAVAKILTDRLSK